MGRRALTLLALLAALAPSASRADTYTPFVGSLHEHSGYSDGYPGSTPATYYASGKGFGLDFLAGSEHSDNSMIPATLSEECLGPGIASCAGGDPNPVNSVLKWNATLAYADAANTSTFTAFRGFEWTSDVFGHINVYFSTNDENAKIDGGYGVTMETFWQWFLRSATLGGGDDGLATFNHPGDKCSLGETDSTCNWNDFAYVPAADDRLVGIEMFNTASSYGRFYARALDKGWHLGAVGAEDLGHNRGDDWGGPEWAKTVILATDRSRAALREAMAARRFYAVRWGDIRMDFTVAGAPMGSRLTRAAGDPIAIQASVNHTDYTLDVVTSGGRVLASGTGSLSATLTASAGDRYYFLRARDAAGNEVAFSSPVWVSV